MRSLLVTTALVLLAAPLGGQTRTAAEGARREATPAASASRAPSRDWQPQSERRLICRGAAIPAGWILVDDTRDMSMCVGDNPAAVVTAYNIWVIERYDTRPVGTTITVCASTPTPPGWVLVDVYRDKALCGHPDEPFQINAKRIRRTR